MLDDFDYKFARSSTKATREDLLRELERVAKIFNYDDFKQTDFDTVAKMHHYTVYREFGTWHDTMKVLAKTLQEKGIDFKITTRRETYTVQEMYEEMDRIWRLLGHRPSRNEWVGSNPKISYDTLYRHFGGWTNACLKFIEHKSGGEVTERSGIIGTQNNNPPNPKAGLRKIAKTRAISLKLRVKVLSRDKFRCVFCGKSPAIDAGTVLHIDHKVPFSRGGENTLSNLQTLCQSCNIGKSNHLL